MKDVGRICLYRLKQRNLAVNYGFSFMLKGQFLFVFSLFLRGFYVNGFLKLISSFF